MLSHMRRFEQIKLEHQNKETCFKVMERINKNLSLANKKLSSISKDLSLSYSYITTGRPKRSGQMLKIWAVFENYLK